MKLTDEERQIMVKLQYEKALSCLHQAEGIASMNFWDTVANRLYYSLFHAVSALLIKDGHKVSTHKASVLLLGQHYVKTGVFTIEEARLFARLQAMREESDYNCVYVTTENEVRPLFEPVHRLIDKIGRMIEQ